MSTLYKTLVLGSLLWHLAFFAKAQNEPFFSQYMFNIQTFNPAYAGTWDNPGLTLISRQQWTDFENNPTSSALTFQYPTRSKKAGFGFSLLNDNIGKLSSNSINLDYSYGLKINSKTILRLGMKGGMLNYRNNMADFVLTDPSDPAFTLIDHNEWMALFGLGTFISNNRFYAGLSFPYLVKKENDYKPNFDRILFIGGLVFKLSEGIDFKPSFNVQYQNNMPVMADINMSFLFAERVWIGAMYRTTDDMNIGFSINFMLGPNLRLAYAYDMMHNSGLNSFSTGTHELMVSFEFRRAKTKFSSPRYF